MKVTNEEDTLLNATFSLKWHKKTSHLVRNMVKPHKIIYIKNQCHILFLVKSWKIKWKIMWSNVLYLKEPSYVKKSKSLSSLIKPMRKEATLFCSYFRNEFNLRMNELYCIYGTSYPITTQSSIWIWCVQLLWKKKENKNKNNVTCLFFLNSLNFWKQK